MKEIIFIFLISHVFSVYYIKKHGSVKVTTQEGIVYLDADKFGKNDKIHMQFNAYRASVDDKIFYEFSDNIPTDTFQPSISKNPDISWSSGGDEDDYDDDKKTFKTNYDIKKNVSAKYLIIKYTGYYKYSNGYLKIENTFVNWGIFIPAFVGSFFGLIILIILIVFCYSKLCKKKCKKNRPDIDSITATELPKTTNDNIESPQREDDIYYEPSIRENENNHSQNENIYYEPPHIENIDIINDSNKDIPQQQNNYYEPQNSAIDNYFANNMNY